MSDVRFLPPQGAALGRRCTVRMDGRAFEATVVRDDAAAPWVRIAFIAGVGYVLDTEPLELVVGDVVLREADWLRPYAFPAQGEYLDEPVLVWPGDGEPGDGETASPSMGGRVVRDDATEPAITVIALDNGQFVLGDECLFRVLNEDVWGLSEFDPEPDFDELEAA